MISTPDPPFLGLEYYVGQAELETTVHRLVDGLQPGLVPSNLVIPNAVGLSQEPEELVVCGGVMRYDQAKYYRILGIVVMVFAIVDAFIPFLGSTVLSGAILGKGIQALSVLEKEGRNDAEWTPSRRRSIIGTIASGIGLLISIALMFLFTLGLAAMLLGQL